MSERGNEREKERGIGRKRKRVNEMVNERERISE